MTIPTRKTILSGISGLLSLLLYTLPSHGQALQAIAYVQTRCPVVMAIPLQLQNL
jgi:hypothetical protein